MKRGVGRVPKKTQGVIFFEQRNIAVEFRPSPEKNAGRYFFGAEKCAREFRPRGP